MPACGGQGHPDTGIAEPDDVCSPVAVYICKLARVGVVAAPAAGVDTEGVKLEHRHDIDRAIRELEKLDIADVVHAIRHTSSQIDDMNRTIRILSDLILRVRAAIDGGVHAGSAIEHVVAGTSLEFVRSAVADEYVRLRATDEVFNTGEDISLGIAARAQAGLEVH